MVKKLKSTLCVLLTFIMLLSCITVGVASVSAAESRMIYFKNTDGWDKVYCYTWGQKANARWPGVEMTKVSDNVWSYADSSENKNVIFNNGKSGGSNQTPDLTIQGNSYIYDNKSGQWSLYNPQTDGKPAIITEQADGTEFEKTFSVTIKTLDAEEAYYKVNDGENVTFSSSASITLGSGVNEVNDYSVYVYAKNKKGVTEQTFTYHQIKSVDRTVEDAVLPEFARSGHLYAASTLDAQNAQAWQITESQSGPSADSGARYFFLPPTADDNQVVLYNTYDSTVIVNNVKIQPNTAALVDYTIGAKTSYTITDNSRSHTLYIMKSDSEVSLFVNDTKGSYLDAEGKEYTDFYSYLVANKENAVSGSACTIIDESGINDTTLKKIKGRGNSTWRDSDKKPFNINFSDKTSIGGISSKKFSLLANAKDGTLLRNRVMYDLADAVDSKYSSDSRSVDLYINGSYRGAYQITQKVELGKNSLVALKDESETLSENFNFLVEVDIWNYAGDTYFVSDKGLHIVLKTPELENYDENDPEQLARMTFIKNKYQQLENALYSGNMTQLEQIIDVDSLATAYLLQEFMKNCDGGLTSCYFTYVASTGKFIADPLWDCDSGLGNVNVTRTNGTNTANVVGWAQKTVYFDKQNVNILGQAFNLSGKTTAGESFNDVVKRLWVEKFIPAINVLKGEAESETRLKSVAEYKDLAINSYKNNYIMWKHQWFPYFGDIGTDYSRNFDGQVKYMLDWLTQRQAWMTKELTGFENFDYYLTGVGFGGWKATDYKLKYQTNGTFTADVVFEKGVEYSFKIFDGGSKYYTASTSDSETTKLVKVTGTNENATVSVTEDTAATIVFDGKSFKVRNVKVVPPAPQLGDVDLDGKVTIQDATLIQRYIAEMSTLSDEQIALSDVNKDESIDVNDVTYLQLALVGIVTI